MRWIAALLAAASFAVGGGAARADDPMNKDKTAVSNSGKNTEINKHVAFVDVYLSEAMTNAKALSTMADAESGKNDKALIGEAQKNIDAAIDRALAHSKHLRGFKADLAAMTPGTGSDAQPRPTAAKGMAGDATARLDELDQHLRDAKAALKKLSGVKMEQLSTTIDGVSTHIIAAQQTFRDIAKWTSYTMLEDQHLGTVPVRGDTGGGDLDRDLGAPATPPSPSDVKPGEDRKMDIPDNKASPDNSLTPSPTPSPNPARTEPTQKAPGGAK